MKFWTVQSDNVLQMILKDGIYNPDFNVSKKKYTLMNGAYDGILKEYKNKNQLYCKGLIYGVSKFNNESILTNEQYHCYFKNDKTFWDSISKSDKTYTLLELNLSDEYDYIPINFQDFIILGMRAIKSKKFKHYVKQSLIEIPFTTFSKDLQIAQKTGWVSESEIKYIEQVHYHQIKMEDIVGVYPTINYEKLIKYPLSNYAKTLLKFLNGQVKYNVMEL